MRWSSWFDGPMLIRVFRNFLFCCADLVFDFLLSFFFVVLFFVFPSFLFMVVVFFIGEAGRPSTLYIYMAIVCFLYVV